MDAEFYSSRGWREVRAQARERDSDRCTVAALLGGDCGGRLHVHHLDPLADPLDLENVACVCSVHHPKWEAVRRQVLAGRKPYRCPHRHRSAEARRQCEARHRRLALSA